MASQRVVISLKVHDETAKKKAMQLVSNISGVDTVSVDRNKMEMTVAGLMDPVKVVHKLRKYNASMVSLGPDEDEEEEIDEAVKTKEAIEHLQEKSKEVVHYLHNIQKIPPNRYHHHHQHQHQTSYSYSSPPPSYAYQPVAYNNPPPPPQHYYSYNYPPPPQNYYYTAPPNNYVSAEENPNACVIS